MFRKISFCVIVLNFFAAAAFAEDFKWDLINAFTRSDMEAAEKIISANIKTMNPPEKKLVMNFAINYTSGENTLHALKLLQKYNIQPGSFDLYTAISRGRQNNAVQYIIQNGAAPNGEILLLAAEKQRFDLVAQFINSGVDVNYQYPLTGKAADGMTPLLHAVKGGDFSTVKLLAEKGANINAQAVNGDSALSLAKQSNNTAIYNYLAEKGAVEPAPAKTPSNTGIAGLAENKIFEFQTGSYRLTNASPSPYDSLFFGFGGNSANTRSLKFSGNAKTGSLQYIDSVNSAVTSGFYRINGNILTVIINTATYTYKLDSNETFSGNGEMWIRSGL